MILGLVLFMNLQLQIEVSGFNCSCTPKGFHFLIAPQKNVEKFCVSRLFWEN